MAKRKIIEINRDLCDGCGLCTTACAEGALQLDGENKAVLVRELYCDGMGACLDVCPTGALKIVEREGEAYDPQAAYSHVLKTRGREAAQSVHGIAAGGRHGHGHDHGHPGGHGHGRHAGDRPEKADAAPRRAVACGCPGSAAREIKREPAAVAVAGEGPAARSELTQWPVQLHLVSPFAPYLKNADLLVAADCTAFALGSFHRDLLKGRKVVIACPKLDDTEGYIEKLADIIANNELRSLTVAVMTVPCCGGLWRMIEEAVERAGSDLRPLKVVVGIDGQIVR